MKQLLAALVCFLPLIILAQGTPDTGNSKLWEMRKKVQQRSTQRAGSYLEQMNQSLDSGDPAAAETALKSAIAQGAMTQSQIDDARAKIDSLVSRQRMAAAAETRANRKSEARAAEAMRVAETNAAQTPSATESSKGSSTNSMANGAPASNGSNAETELDRFYARNRGGTRTFVVTRDDGWSRLRDDAWVTLKDTDNGKQWALNYSPGFSDQYNKGNTGGLTINNESLVGTRVSVYFHGSGEPESIKNLDNGNTCRVRDWKVTGYGW